MKEIPHHGHPYSCSSFVMFPCHALSSIVSYQHHKNTKRAFLAQMTSFVMPYGMIYHSFPINSQYLMMQGVDDPVTHL